MGGNTDVCMGGWFRREIKSVADVRGLTVRSLGLGCEVNRRLGAVAQTTSPGEILVALQSGVIDGEPNGTGECIVSLKAWETLDSEMKAIVAHVLLLNYSSAIQEQVG
jgi:Bacterial extracellular solute-binding protein, family 7